MNDNQIWLKLVPRMELNPNKKKTFAKAPKTPFNEDHPLMQEARKDSKITKTQANHGSKDDLHFWQYKGKFYRKGFVYMPKALKELETENIKPRPDERTLFLRLYQ